MDLESSLILLLAAPILAAGFILCTLRKRHWLGVSVSVLAAGVIAVVSLYLCTYTQNASPALNLAYEYFSMGDLRVNLGFLFDNTTILMLLVVGCIGFLIHIFSIGYMDDDVARSRFFGGLSIFMFSMLGIVIADNLITIFVFWELVGFSSYALIAHYYQTDEAAQASKKAFIVNRIGDLGFLLGILWCYAEFGTVNLVVLEKVHAANPELLVRGVGLLLICGFIGKSAQFPLHVWLPDAMAGPTPVSALIHAATMVAAGIYLLARISFMLTEDVLEIILWLGSSMAVVAGLWAIVQTDIKKILAYSTLSQLGYMAMAVGLGKTGLALFHLSTHACFKALLFLGAGSLIHAMHHEQDIFKMGGLLKKMPISAICFLVGLLALCGINGTAGYFSKDAIIAASIGKPAIFWMASAGVFLTAFYMGRLFVIAFLGSANSKKSESAKESSFVMWVPLLILAVLSVVSGYLELWPENIRSIVLPEFEAAHAGHGTEAQAFMLSGGLSGLGAFGLLLAFLVYRPGASADRFAGALPILAKFLGARLWFDPIYNAYVSKVQDRLARLLEFIDTLLVGGLLVRATSSIFGLAGLLARQNQNGQIAHYLNWFVAGTLLFGAFAAGLL